MGTSQSNSTLPSSVLPYLPGLGNLPYRGPPHRVDNLIQILPGVTKRYRGVAEVVAVEPQALEFSPNLVRCERKQRAC